ncbi:MAG: restriction endonuclease subunit S, partial [Candidatus Pacebacteria bacterium]|nr:restriction endonuclease subunit S [Candidatus Paceibacterota bacterium]
MSESPWPLKPLAELFKINGEQTFPAAHPCHEFVHYSIPAWDANGQPLVELGAAIESNKTAIKSESVLVSKLNPRKPRVAVIQRVEQRFCASTEFICYQPKRAAECLSFWGAYFSTGDFSRRLERVAIGSTNSHTRANPKETLSWLVPDPDSAEKEKIAEVFAVLNTTIQQTEAIVE